MSYPTNESMREAIDKSNAQMREIMWFGADWAKSGSDRTIVTVIPMGLKLKPEWLAEEYPIVPAPVIPPCPIAEAAFPQKSETDRIWDLIVLAAESSRYG